MKHLIEQHGLAFVEALKKLVAEPMGTLITLMVIALSLAVPATLYRVADVTRTLVQDESHRPSIVLVLKDGLKDEQIRSLKESLIERKDLRHVHFTSPDEGLSALQSRLGRQDLLAGLDSNPLPAIFTVQPSELNPDKLTSLTEALQSLPGVDHVKLDAEWAKRLHAMGRFVEEGVLGLGLILLVAVLTVVINTIRLQISRAHEEIQVSKLIGASDTFVRRPFLYFGALEMGLGTAIALGLGELARSAFNALSSEWLAPLGIPFIMPGLTPTDIGIALLGAVFLGGLVASGTVSFALMRFGR